MVPEGIALVAGVIPEIACDIAGDAGGRTRRVLGSEAEVEEGSTVDHVQ